MNKLKLFLIVSSLASSLSAKEVPSIGFHAWSQKLSGNRSEIDLQGTSLQRVQSGAENRTLSALGIDLHLPVKHGLSLNLNYDNLSGEEEFSREAGIYKQSVPLEGYKVGFEIRLDLSK